MGTMDEGTKEDSEENGRTQVLGGNSDALFPGLTKREYMATHILAGFAADTNTGSDIEINAKYAVKWADALLLALEK